MIPSSIRHPIRLILATWTGVLAILVVSSARAIPPVLLALLLPYLAIVALHLLGPILKDETAPGPGLPEDLPGPAVEPEGSPLLPSASSDIRVDLPETLETASAQEARPSTLAPTRPRRKARPRVAAEPARASFVQVGPGRFVRGEEPDPAPVPPEGDGPGPEPIEPDEAGLRPEDEIDP